MCSASDLLVQGAKRRPARRGTPTIGRTTGRTSTPSSPDQRAPHPVLLTIVSTPRGPAAARRGSRHPSGSPISKLRVRGRGPLRRHARRATGETLPEVVRWEAWNEPNLQAHLRPQWKAVGTTRQVGRPFCFGKSWVPASPGIYRGILNAIYRGVHAAGNAAGLTSPSPAGRPPRTEGARAQSSRASRRSHFCAIWSRSRCRSTCGRTIPTATAARTRRRTAATTSTCRGCHASTRR